MSESRFQIHLVDLRGPGLHAEDFDVIASVDFDEDESAITLEGFAADQVGCALVDAVAAGIQRAYKRNGKPVEPERVNYAHSYPGDPDPCGCVNCR